MQQQVLALLDARGTILYATDTTHITRDRLTGRAPWDLGYTAEHESSKLKVAFADAMLFQRENPIAIKAHVAGRPLPIVVLYHAVPAVAVAAIAVMLVIDSKIDSLTPRERQICQLRGRGHEAKQIASILGCTTSTVHTNLSHLRAKLHLGSVALDGWCAVNVQHF